MILIALALCSGTAAASPVAETACSPLRLAVVIDGTDPVLAAWRAEPVPRLVLAQRAIDREWSVVGDSGQAGLHVEGMKSEVGAAAMSAVIPGSGQIYAGQASGYAFAAAEVAGWIGYLLLRDSGHELRDQASTFAGEPQDSASAWSFDRAEESGADVTPLRVLYDHDREAYYDAIDADQRYAGGWSTPDAHNEFGDLRDRSNQRLAQARVTGGALWVNHLVAAVDALRAARLGNLDLRLKGDVALKARGSLKRGRPSLLVTLERRF